MLGLGLGITRKKRGGGGAPATLLTSRRIGGQAPTQIDFMGGVMSGNFLDRARNVGPISGPNQYAEASRPMRVAKIRRVSNTVRVTFVRNWALDHPAEYEPGVGLFTSVTFFKDTSLDADVLAITGVGNIGSGATYIEYTKAGPDVAEYTLLNEGEVACGLIYTVPLGSDGQPTAPCRVVLSAAPWPNTKNKDLDGVWNGYFDGDSPSSMTFDGPALTGFSGEGDGTFTVTVDGNDTGAMICNILAGVGAGFKLPRMHRVGTDQSGATYLIPEAHEYMSRASAWRWMDAQRTVGNFYAKGWTNRIKVQVGLGMPIEDIIKACNELQAHPWVCIPTEVDDNYVTQFATLALGLLNAGLALIVERGDELWNEAFPGFHWERARLCAYLKAYFHGFTPNGYGEDAIASVTRNSATNTVTVTMNAGYPVPFNNGDTAVFTVVNGTAGYSTPNSGAVMSVSGLSFSFVNTGSANGAIGTLNEAHIIGNCTDPIYADGHLTDVRYMVARSHAKRVYEISQLIEAVQPGVLASGRVRMALMGFEENTFAYDNYVYPWLAGLHGPIKNYIYYIGGAPYPKVMGVDGDPNNWTLAELQTSLTAKLVTTKSRAAAMRAKADALEVHHAMYEFNINYAANEDGPSCPAALIDSAHTDPIGRAMQHAMIDAISPYVDLAMLYFMWPGWPNSSGAQSWHTALSISDDKTIGAANDEHTKGLDDALLTAVPAP